MSSKCSSVAVTTAITPDKYTLGHLRLTVLPNPKFEALKSPPLMRKPLTCISFFPHSPPSRPRIPLMGKNITISCLIITQIKTAWLASFKGRSCVYGTNFFSVVNWNISCFFLFVLSHIMQTNQPQSPFASIILNLGRRRRFKCTARSGLKKGEGSKMKLTPWTSYRASAYFKALEY